ncbi:coagulation factor IXa [Xiphias gladius]|uniref:coagulation factor IXa n=1 Tax=Xiphias gladius TaxID=8245 RepID=UPI001A987C65|nr:coagulation factor IXa [Xiphias gladius]
MELVSLSLLSFLLWGFQLDPGAPAPASGPVFLSGQAADSVLRRHKRHNTGLFEELLEGNLERECIKEVCDLEEAREFFENDEETMEFWAGYVDGNQCKPNPCQNQGSCEDHRGSYTCKCPSGFTGRNCEIVIEKRCDMNNGDCMHFCESLGTFGAKCSCATGYRLMEDGVNCESEAEFPCGRTALTAISTVSRRSLLGHENASLQNTTSLTNVTTTNSPPSTPASIEASVPATTHSAENVSRKKLPLWVYSDAEVPIEEPLRPRKRIVGGAVVIPGEIPWQVALILRTGGQLFCGGSILSERWVITAAHCLVQVQGSFFVRVGEHNIYINEGTEQDHDVLEQHLHPRYNTSISLYNHDIALVYLKTPITFSTTVRPICIGPRTFTEALLKGSSPATVSGWGRTRFLGSTANTLQKVEVPLVDRTECKQSTSARITPVMFCAGYDTEAKDACQGDSGGPHANRIHDTWFLTGIVSWGEECAKDGKYVTDIRLPKDPQENDSVLCTVVRTSDLFTRTHRGIHCHQSPSCPPVSYITITDMSTAARVQGMERQKDNILITNQKRERPIRLKGLAIDCPRGLNSSRAFAVVPLQTFTIRKHWPRRLSIKTWRKITSVDSHFFFSFFLMSKLC